MPRLLSITLLAAAALALCLSAAPQDACAAAKKSEQTAQEKAKVEGERDSLKKRLGDLQKQLSEKEEENEAANAALKKADLAISDVNARLKELRTDRQQTERRLAQLKREGRTVDAGLSDAQRLVEQIARAQYLNMQRTSWQSLIDGTNPNDRGRTAAQLKYLAHAQARAVDALEAQQTRIQSVADETKAKQSELARIAREEEKSRQELLEEKRDRQSALKRLNREIASQQAAIENLKKDQSHLENLVNLIDKRLAAERAQEAAAEKRRLAEAQRKAAQQPRAEAQKPIALMKGGNFAKLKGKLTRPVSGRVAANFGTKRTGTAKWQGMRFRAPEGAEVSACAAGTVVFSDWLRGYGNLIIVDHGNTYMSVYANNESVYVRVGDKVKQGETIATVGNSGGDDEPGLYFEIRYKGKPVNPAPWLRK